VSEEPPFDTRPFFWGVALAFLYLIVDRLDIIIKLLEATK